MKDIVNIKIKFREPFRPFAPSVLAESADDYFYLPDAADHYPARFMLYVVDVKEDKPTPSLPSRTSTAPRACKRCAPTAHCTTA